MHWRRGLGVVVLKLAGLFLLAVVGVWVGWGIWRVQAAYRIANEVMSRSPRRELPSNYVEVYFLRLFTPIVLKFWMFLSVTWFCVAYVLRPELRRRGRPRSR